MLAARHVDASSRPTAPELLVGCGRSLTATLRGAHTMRKDVREFIRRLEAAGLTVESTPGHYRVLRDGKPLRKASGMPFMLPFSPDTIRWRRAAIVDLRKLGIHV
jgi:biotin operon repressor